MLRKKRFTKFLVEKIAPREASSLIDRAFSAGQGYTFKIKFVLLIVKIGISEESKMPF